MIEDVVIDITAALVFTTTTAASSAASSIYNNCRVLVSDYIFYYNTTAVLTINYLQVFVYISTKYHTAVVVVVNNRYQYFTYRYIYMYYRYTASRYAARLMVERFVMDEEVRST